MSVPTTVSHGSDFDVAQEGDVVASRKISAILVAAVVITIVALAIARWILAVAASALPSHPALFAPVAPREIAGIHQTLIGRDRHGWQLRDEQLRSLDEYRWINRERGIAQIPIDRAMQIVVDETTRAKAVP
jgi:hypothetical protein